MILKVRKKPIVVEAMKYTGENYYELCEWAEQKLKRDPARKLLLPTLEGPMKASIYDYVIKGIQGELYGIKPDIFHETYEILE
jgi:hypothetical protein